MNQHQKALVKLLRGLNHRHNLYTAFADFVELAAISVSNSMDMARARERGKRYLSIIGKYQPDEQRQFPRMPGWSVSSCPTGRSPIGGAA